jgi:NADH dehydrogenase
MKAKKVKILVLGGGFAGVKTVRKLHRNPNLDITLITDQETFRYGATIWRAAVGHLREASYLPVASLVPIKPNVHLVYDKALTIDRPAKSIKTEKGKTYHYDYCVIGLGAVTSYFGIKGLDKYSYGVKSSKEFDEFRHHLHQELVDEHALDKNYIVVGAGPTGVELAAALRSYLKTVAKHHKLPKTAVHMQLVEAAPRILPTLEPKASSLTLRRLRSLGVTVHTHTTVKEETANTLLVGNKPIPTHTVIWTAGVTTNPFFAANNDQFALNEKKKVVVDGNLKVDSSVFVIGDNAATPFSGLALTALHNASYVAQAIHRELEGRKMPFYKPLKPVTIIPVGENWSIFQWRKLVISGRFASWLRTMYDFLGYAEIMGVRPAAAIWLRRNHVHEECPFCQPPNK